MPKKLEVEVLYSGGIRMALDNALLAEAKKLGGKFLGGGCFLLGGGQRDLSFRFKTDKDAKAFGVKARAILEKNGAKVS